MNRLLKKEKRPILVMFYAPWCGFCKRLKPEYAAAASELKGSVVLAGMDVNKPENADIEQQYNVTGFPTLLYFEHGKFRFNYGGENNKEGLIAWMKDPHPPKEKEAEKNWSDEISDVVHLKDGDFHEFIAQNPSVLVMFYAPWCGHCKAMKPDFVTAAAQLKEEGVSGVLAAVDATAEKAVGAELDIQGFPTLKYFQNGKYAWDFRERSLESMVEFMKDPKEPPPPPPPEPEWQEMPGDVVHLNAENFKAELKRKKHALVIFYAPWCGHCKAAKPEFSAAATTYREEGKIIFAAVDCTAHNELCKEYDVDGFPTIIYFSYLKHTEPYSGGRTQADFEAFMRQVAGIPISDSQPETTEPPVPEPPIEEDIWDPAVRVLSPMNFENALKPVERALVMFYVPWCGHCKKAKPEFSEAAAILKDNTEYLLGTVDCSSYKEFCSEAIKKFPSFRMYEKGIFKKDYTGKRTTADFVTGLSEKPEKKKPPSPPQQQEFLFDPAVKILEPGNFETVSTSAKDLLVMFYAPWCGHCKQAKPEFSAAATELSEDKTKTFGAVDCTVHRELCLKHEVRGYPTFLLFTDGKFAKKYTGGRAKIDFVNGFLAEKETGEKPPASKPKEEEGWSTAVKMLTAENFESTLLLAKGVLVMFYAPWCGHCKKAKPEFSAAASALAEDSGKMLAALDCTNYKDLCSEKGVKSYPTFQIYENGKFSRPYSGQRSKESFMTSLTGKTEL